MARRSRHVADGGEARVAKVERKAERRGRAGGPRKQGSPEREGRHPATARARTRGRATREAERHVGAVKGGWAQSASRRPLSAANDNEPAAAALDQFYTAKPVAKDLYAEFVGRYSPERFLIIEPSAGTGSFLDLLPEGSLAYDLDPKRAGIVRANFLEVEIAPVGDHEICAIGNPPFGKNASMATRFFNHAAKFAAVIAFIVPRTFRKGSIQNRLHSDFHLVAETPVPRDAFLYDGAPYDVPAVFQIWERRSTPRAKRPTATRHADFEFTTPDRADFAIQRIGARAGRVHHDLSASPSSHYFIKGDVEAAMRRLDLTGSAADVAGNPSLAKAEIVAMYEALVAAPPQTGAPAVRSHTRTTTPARRLAAAPRSARAHGGNQPRRSGRSRPRTGDGRFAKASEAKTADGRPADAGSSPPLRTRSWSKGTKRG